jgi:hypothetical protein
MPVCTDQGKRASGMAYRLSTVLSTVLSGIPSVVLINGTMVSFAKSSAFLVSNFVLVA